MIPITVAGGSEGGVEAQAASDDVVEEIQWRPRDGRQHVYCGASVGTIGPAMKSSPRPRRRQGWSALLSGSLKKLR